MTVPIPALETTSDDLKSRAEVRAMLTVSRAVLRGGSLSAILDRIAAEATRVAPGADRSSVILIEGPSRRFRLAGSHGLSESYKRLLTTGEAKLRPGEGPSGVAYATRVPVVIDDVDTDPRLDTWTWRDIVRAEGYRAIVSLPLIPEERVVGTLNLYRAAPGRWPADQVRLLTFFAEHAASAVRTAQLLDQRREQVAALQRLVRALREQAHEHANRLHAVSGLLALGETQEAREFLQVVESTHAAAREALDARIEAPTVAGMVLAEMVVAAQRGVALTIDETSRLHHLPPALSETQAVTIIGNLLDNAFDAVAEMPTERRKVRLLLDDTNQRTVIEVADLGEGLPPADIALLEHGVTTKPGHQGLGLALVQRAVTAAMGKLEFERNPQGTTFRVTIPG